MHFKEIVGDVVTVHVLGHEKLEVYLIDVLALRIVRQVVLEAELWRLKFDAEVDWHNFSARWDMWLPDRGDASI